MRQRRTDLVLLNFQVHNGLSDRTASLYITGAACRFKEYIFFGSSGRSPVGYSPDTL